MWLPWFCAFTLAGWLCYYGSLLEGRYIAPPVATRLRWMNLSDVHASPGWSGAGGGTGCIVCDKQVDALIAQQLKLPRKDADAAVDAIFNSIASSLEAGRRVEP